MHFSRLAISFVMASLVLANIFSSTGHALAYSTSGGYAATDYITGIPYCCDPVGGRGPMGLAFDSAGNLYVTDFQDAAGYTSVLYRFAPGGGVASSATEVGNAPPYTLGLTFGLDGNLYASNLFGETVVQLSTSTGAAVRTVADLGPGCGGRGIATDPVSGDLFVASSCGIERISHYASGTGTVTNYVPSLTAVDGLSFGPDGTLYAADSASGSPMAIAGTDSVSPGSILEVYPATPELDGIGVGIPSPSSSTGFLMVNRNNGTITKIDTSTNPATLTDIFTGGSRGDLVATGADGCLYATQTDRIVKVTNSDGTCSLYPSQSFLAAGAFALGDVTANAALGNGSSVTWWSSQWSMDNQLSGGAAPSAFKGFADTTSTTPPTCGGTWTAHTGNSSSPPATVPPAMAVIVTSKATQSGNIVSGTIAQIDLVLTNPGYGPAPGHTGTGEVVAVICHS